MQRQSDKLDFINLFLNEVLKADSNLKFKMELIEADASFRNYERIFLESNNYIIMDSSVDSIEEFLNISLLLKNLGFSVPEIHKFDKEKNFIIMEDLGSALLSEILTKNNLELNKTLYKLSIDNIIKFQKIETLPLPEHSEDFCIEESLLYIDWYLKGIYNEEISSHLREEFIQIWRTLLPFTHKLPRVFIHRDYHASNLLFLESRLRENQIGIIDYQDAMIGNPAYDVVSLLEDARIDVPFDLADQMIDYYLLKSPHIARKEFLASYSILGAQRNMKIIGIFARKAFRDNNSKYLKLIPRVKKYLTRDLTHPLLVPLKNWLSKV